MHTYLYYFPLSLSHCHKLGDRLWQKCVLKCMVTWYINTYAVRIWLRNYPFRIAFLCPKAYVCRIVIYPALDWELIGIIFIGTKFCSKPQETCKASPEICRNIFVSEMTCIVSSGALNSTHSLTVGTCHRRWCHSRVTSSTAALVTFQSHRELKFPILKAVSFFSRVASANKFTSFYSK